MTHAWHEIAFTQSVKSLQESRGSRASYERFEAGPVRGDRIGPDEAAFIGARDSFYMASVGQTGWPYIQHRGGPRGFMRVLDEKTLAFADFAGNKQYVSLGNFQTEDRVSLFFMDYTNRGRLKVFGRIRVVEASDSETLAKLALPDYRAKVERGLCIKVEAVDWNCPQHITERYTKIEVEQIVAKLAFRVRELEAKLTQTDP